ncbi:MAG: tetraacyldisaccharide 4'-kinase [Crocinitomicaceae bacterium]
MRLLRFLLLPFSLLYGVVTWVRNKLFDFGLKEQFNIPFPSITVGNLSTGGTGKTPHVLLLNKWLSKEKKVVVVSRGYGRKTKGLLWADENSTAESIGDEPLLFLHAEPKPSVIVSEKRRLAIDDLVKKPIENAVVLLDDAFQHRHVKAGINIVLTDFSKPYFNDFMLPTGNLREFRLGIKRADYVIVTKTPVDLSPAKKEAFSSKIKRKKDTIYFSSIVYSDIETLDKSLLQPEIEYVVLVTGIANPEPLETHLKKKYDVHPVVYPDHYQFKEPDIEDIHGIFGNFAREKTIILTTEKDAVRLEKFKEIGLLKKYPWCIQKITVEIDREQELKDKLIEYVRKV